MAEDVIGQGYFSILKWAPDATRDEPRNVAVVLMDSEGQFGGVRAAPMSSISSNLRDQGILDKLVLGLSDQFASQEKPDLERIRELQGLFTRSLHFSEPRPAAVVDVDATLLALYRAYVAPKSAPRSESKGVVLDRVVSLLRRNGYTVRRGEYMGDFFFDAIVDAGRDKHALDVLSFATSTKDWTTAEKDAGHFLFAISEIGIQGHAVVRPPGDKSAPTASISFARVGRWFEKADVPVLEPEALVDLKL